MSTRCPEAYKVWSMPTVGLRRAHCPNCGRVISFHWATGRFANHNAPEPDTDCTKCGGNGYELVIEHGTLNRRPCTCMEEA